MIKLTEDDIEKQLIFSNIQIFRDQKIPLQYCVGLKTTDAEVAKEKILTILKAIKFYNEIYPCSGGFTSLSVKETLELLELKQRIEKTIKDLDEDVATPGKLSLTGIQFARQFKLNLQNLLTSGGK